LNSDDAIIQELRRLNGTPPALFKHPELLRLTIDILAADFALVQAFATKNVIRSRQTFTC